MKHYKLRYLPLFSEDLNSIVRYISVVLGDTVEVRRILYNRRNISAIL